MQMIVSNASAGIAAGANHVRTAAGAAVLGLQGCAITYTPSGAGYREANSCAPEPVNVPPRVEVGGPYASIEGETVDLSGSASDENGDALTYAWSIGDGTNMNGNPVSHSFVDNGEYPATLAVSDGALVTLVTTRVDVSNGLPSLGALEGATRFIGEAYDVSVSLSDPGVLDAPWHYSIAWGDGASDEGDATSLALPIRGSHRYSEPGTYTVRVTLRDKDNGAATDVEAQVLVKIDEIDIDIKPWHYSNRIYMKGPFDRLIPVAVLTSGTLDAKDVNVSSLRLGGVPVAKLKHGSHFSAPSDMGNWGSNQFTFENGDLAVLVDVDRDGDKDLLVVFDRDDLIKAGDLARTTGSLTLNGLTIDGRKVVGTDAVQIVR
jgi:PKD repeat protein